MKYTLVTPTRLLRCSRFAGRSCTGKLREVRDDESGEYGATHPCLAITALKVLTKLLRLVSPGSVGTLKSGAFDPRRCQSPLQKCRKSLLLVWISATSRRLATGLGGYVRRFYPHLFCSFLIADFFVFPKGDRDA
jgi:hypothetical protein